MTAAEFIRPHRSYGDEERPTARARAEISSPQAAAEPPRRQAEETVPGRCAVHGYPSRPVKIIMPFAPGGPTEFIIRLVADRLTAKLGQAFVIENRPGGAGGTVGAKSVAVAEPDGYTLL